MWQQGWRDQVWAQLEQPWDLIVIGGGITGAGILRAAAKAGLRALLLEAQDFAFGTSSRSSKLVHGGIRYLRNFQLKVTSESVRERERLLREAPCLVEPLEFIIVTCRGDPAARWKFGAGVVAYDLMGGKWAHGVYSPQQLCRILPALGAAQPLGAIWYYDARVDDARLVLRTLCEATAAGGAALNYAPVRHLLRNQRGEVCGVAVCDAAPGGGDRAREVMASVVVNATGPWADEVRAQIGAEARLRKSRGSHLVFPRSKFPIQQSFTLLHPRDNRMMFAIPWEGVTLVGTTDLDHSPELEAAQPEPAIQAGEVEYLLEALGHSFPGLALTTKDIQATFAGLRPMVNTGKADPSKESREHIILCENALVTITGGKLTTYRLMAQQTLKAVRRRFGMSPRFDPRQATFDCLPEICAPCPIEPGALARLRGRFGAETMALLNACQPGELEPIGESPCLWGELRWAARAEGVVHLDDLLLRRVRLGLLVPEGGLGYMDRIRAIVQPELGWEAARWEQELTDYARRWKQCYAVPE